MHIILAVALMMAAQHVASFAQTPAVALPSGVSAMPPASLAPGWHSVPQFCPSQPMIVLMQLSQLAVSFDRQPP